MLPTDREMPHREILKLIRKLLTMARDAIDHEHEGPKSSSSKIVRVLSGLRQALRAIIWCLIIVASLVVFPNGIPWLIAVWLLAYTLLILMGRRGFVGLGLCAAVILAKRPTLAPGLSGLIVLILAIAVIGIWQNRKGKPDLSRRFALLSLPMLWIAWGGMAWDWHYAAHCHHAIALKSERPVVCLGDSMTSLGLFGGYPDDLRKLISLPVVNMGIGGITAKDVAENKLPKLIRHNPQIVVIELGGHDFLRGYSRSSTKASLKKIIDASRQIGAEVILMEIPRSFMSDPYWGLEREIAREEGIELIPDTAMRTLFLRSPVFPPGSWLGDPYLTDETGIHANTRGQKILAEAVAGAIENLYGRRIRMDREP
jgi:acyl-CoA thioesterase I